MVFNSSIFLYFLVIITLAYLVVGTFKNARLYQNRLLLLASYYFYGYWDWVFLGLIVISTLTDYWAAIAIENSDNKNRRRFFLIVSMSVNLGLLGAFKYFDFFISSFVVMSRAIVPGSFPGGADSMLLHILLPVGISFYTFQTMSYTIDVYRGVIKSERNFWDFALFVCFFPQLVAGPIERAGDLMPALKGERKFDWDNFQKGAWLILLGFFMKTYVADNLSPLVDMVYLPDASSYHQHPEFAAGYGGWHVLLASIAFTFQIYGDFGGYSLIAMGSSRLLGIPLSINFMAPLYSRSPGELWNRWHITLGRWVRDYIYIPLGGSRAGEIRKYWNLFVTFTLMGLWHGANWTFVLWGAYQGVWLAIAGFGDKYLRLPENSSPRLLYFEGLSKRIVVFFAFAVTATLFRAYDLTHSMMLWNSLATFPWPTGEFHGVVGVPTYALDIFRKLFILLLLDLALYRTGDLFWIFRRPVWLRVIVYFVLFFHIVSQGVFGKDVIYFAF